MAAVDILGHAAWWFLPGIVTGYLQTFYYTIITRAGDPKPAPGSARFIRDRKRIHAFVIIVYLLYTIYETDYQLRVAGDFYSILGVPHDVSDRGVQSRFRRLTMQYHPDKISGPEKSFAEAHYVNLQLARDVLSNPAKRFAYDRLGPDVLAWQSSKTIRDFSLKGLQHTAIYYVGSGSVLILLSVLGYMEAGKFWRFWTLGALFALEVHVITRPAYPAVLAQVVNPVLERTGLRTAYVPYQMLSLLRKLSITLFIALNQLAPLFAAKPTEQGGEPGAVSPQMLDRLDALTKTTDREMARLLSMELSPFAGEARHLRDLKQGVKEWLVQNTLRNDPEVKAAVAKVLEGRRGRMVAEGQQQEQEGNGG